MAISQEKKDKIYNACIVGMSPTDAYVYARLTPEEISELDSDPEYQRELGGIYREVEYNLLDNMRRAAVFQVGVGKHDATAWLLERLYPRYNIKNVQDTTGTIRIVMEGDKDDNGPNVTIVE